MQPLGGPEILLSELSEYLEVEQLDGLISAAGAAGVRDIYDAFNRSTATLLDQMSVHLANKTVTDAGAAAHSLKGSAANVGALKIAEIALAIENASKIGDSSEFAAQLSMIQDHVEKTFEHIYDYLQRH